MRKTAMIILFILLLIWSYVSVTTLAHAGTACGFRPLKPLIKLGCKDMVATCRCDSSGNICQWEWICVTK